jgi:hypothetical protein
MVKIGGNDVYKTCTSKNAPVPMLPHNNGHMHLNCLSDHTKKDLRHVPGNIPCCINFLRLQMEEMVSR